MRYKVASLHNFSQNWVKIVRLPKKIDKPYFFVPNELHHAKTSQKNP